MFTSGATESNNLAIKGVAARAPQNRRHIVTVSTEHRAVLDPCGALGSGRLSHDATCGVNADGQLDLQQLSEALADDTLLLSVMSANNEIGVLHPLAESARMAHARGVIFHCDAVQSAGIIPLNARELGIDLVSLSAHKIYGPKGVGALYIVAKDEPRARHRGALGRRRA